MKRLLLLCFALAVGCHAQIPSNPTAYSCPDSTGTNYTALNQASPATALTYTDSHPVAATYCYIAQSVMTDTAQVSDPSNTAGPLTTNGTNSVELTWTAPTTGPTPDGYVLSRAVAVPSTLLAPKLGTGSVAAISQKTNGQMALKAKVR